MPERDPLGDRDALDLMEHRRVPQVVVVPEHPPRADHPDRRPARQHGADLHRRGMGAQQQAVLEEEGVLRVARRVVRREVERREVVEVGLDLRTLGHAVAEPGEDLDHLALDEGDRVEVAQRGPAAGQGDVDARAPALGLALAVTELGVELGEARLDAVLEGVDRLAVGPAVLGRHLAGAGEQGPHDALLAPGPAQAQVFPGLAVADLGGLALEVLPEPFDLGRSRGGGRRGAVRHQASAGAGSGEAGSACLARSAISPKAFRSCTARSARILRSISRPAAFNPAMRRL